MIKKDGLIQNLRLNSIDFDIFEHKALYTVKDSEENRVMVSGGHTKNLFLKNKKNEFFLLSCHEKTKVQLKNFSKCLKIGNLSFAKESYMLEFLGVTPGSVSPFALINDIDNKVMFIIDKKLFDFDTINFHPLINTATLSLKTKDFLIFLSKNKKDLKVFNFNNYSLMEK